MLGENILYSEDSEALELVFYICSMTLGKPRAVQLSKGLYPSIFGMQIKYYCLILFIFQQLEWHPLHAETWRTPVWNLSAFDSTKYL